MGRPNKKIEKSGFKTEMKNKTYMIEGQLTEKDDQLREEIYKAIRKVFPEEEYPALILMGSGMSEYGYTFDIDVHGLTAQEEFTIQ